MKLHLIPLRAACALLFTLLVVACGGGGGGSEPTTGISSTPTPTPTPTPAPTAMACDGSTSIGSGNVAPLFVDGFPCAAGGTVGAANVPNTPYVSVQVCAPGSTTNCQTIDHVILDTGSTGLRIAASALNASLQPGSGGLPVMAGAAAGTVLTECEAYVSSYVYGPVVSADVYIAGKKVGSTQLQVFGAPGYAVPRGCSNQGGTQTDTTQLFGGNGLLGVSFDVADNYSLYYDCQAATGSSCSADNSYPGMPNTVTQFSGDNNGVVLSLPAVGSAGSTTVVVGTLTFGVATQSNNTPPAGTLAIVNDGTLSATGGTFAAAIGGTWSMAYIDSGTDVVYFDDTADPQLTACPGSGLYAGYYCPAAAQSLVFTLANTGSTAAVGTLPYTVVDASMVYGTTAIAVGNVGGADSSSSTGGGGGTIAFGLSAFFGHDMYFLFNGMTAPGAGLGGAATGTGPVNGIH